MPSTADTPLPVSPGDLLAGKYEIQRMLGRGGMGFVVAARHRDLGHLVAIKMLLPALAARADVVERFLREGRAAVQLRSEHVTRVTDVGVHQEPRGAADMPNGVPYLVMEYLDGTSLGGLTRQGSLQTHDAALYLIQACDALDEAHRLGIVHRDLKPDNLFLTQRPNGAPLVKVLDFGISRVPFGDDERRLTGAADVMGTPHYMAPEQMESARNADARSDVWALGVTLYELLTNRLPFQGSNVAEICAQVLKAQPFPPRAHRPDLSAEVEALILRCLTKDPAARYQSAAELAEALAPFAPGGARTSRQVNSQRSSVGDDASDEAATLYRPSGQVAQRDGAIGSPGAFGADAPTGSETRDGTTHIVRARHVRGLVATALGIPLLGVLGVFAWKHVLPVESNDDVAAAASPLEATPSLQEPPMILSAAATEAPTASAAVTSILPSVSAVASVAPTTRATVSGPPTSSKTSPSSSSGLKKNRK